MKRFGLTAKAISVGSVCAVAWGVLPAPAGAVQPGDWKTAEGGGAKEAPPLTPEEQARYDKVARLIVRHINANDAEAYRALFTDAGWETSIDWWQNMFAMQRDRFGPIVKVYKPSRSIVRLPGGMGIGPEEGCAGMVVQFEDPAGGLLSFRLNDDNKIVQTSAYVIEQLADYAGPASDVIYDRAARAEEAKKKG